jgi:hypothetical protein
MDKTYTILLPNQNQKENTIQDTIITILMEEWPLSTKGLYSRIKQQSNRNYSLQATYKATKKLYTNNIIEKNGQFYRLNYDWLTQMQEISTNIIQKYDSKNISLKDMP